MKYLILILFYSVTGYLIGKPPTMIRTFMLLNKLSNSSSYELEQKNGLNITAIREYLRNKLDTNNTNIKNQSQ